GVACESEGSSDCWLDEANRLAGQTVEARDASGTLLGTTVTDSWGGFYIENLVPGKITVSLEPPPGMESERVETTLGPNEGEWEIQLHATRVFVRHGLNSSVSPTEIVSGSESDIHLEAVFAGVVDSVAPFDVTGVVVSLHLPEGLSYVRHAGYGTYDPSTGLWSIPSLRYLSRAGMTITVTAKEEGTYRPHAEIVASDWPDKYTLFGDGLGFDYTEVAVTVAATDAVDDAEPLIAGVAWDDTDSDGVRDEPEEGIPDITIVATAADGTVFAATTGNEGEYSFIKLPPGTYRVEPDPATVPEGMEAPATVYVFELVVGNTFTADFGFTELPGLTGWWIVGLVLGLGLLIGLVYWVVWMRRRTPPTPPEPTESNVGEELELASSPSPK
ncbi:MAG: hypothetical protein OEM39_01170, partial [Acidimicrobiia bacterium]|nr:hypothetical protein [Acidimicrobiia bacterium]